MLRYFHGYSKEKEMYKENDAYNDIFSIAFLVVSFVSNHMLKLHLKFLASVEPVVFKTFTVIDQNNEK